MMFKELKEKRSSSHDNASAKKENALKILKYFLGGSVNSSLIFAFRGGVLKPNPHERRGKNVCVLG
jgi:hypothetical protein